MDALAAGGAEAKRVFAAMMEMDKIDIANRRFLEREKLVDPHLHAFIHHDERWPGAFETFTRNFLRRINAEFAAARDFAGGMVE